MQLGVFNTPGVVDQGGLLLPGLQHGGLAVLHNGEEVVSRVDRGELVPLMHEMIDTMRRTNGRQAPVYVTPEIHIDGKVLARSLDDVTTLQRAGVARPNPYVGVRR
jgi:hypothetical protein